MIEKTCGHCGRGFAALKTVRIYCSIPCGIAARSPWTPERVATMADLYGMRSASQTAAVMGMTKNQVIGAAWRRGIGKKPPAARPRPQWPLPPLGRCVWPIGDPCDPDFSFCGEKATPGRPYCAEHCGVAYMTAGGKI